jgi:predicted Zn-dependent protease
MNKGTYRESPSETSLECELVLAEHKIYIYFNSQQRDLLIWDLNALESCLMLGGVLKIVKEKIPGQHLECSGEIAKDIYAAYLNPQKVVVPDRPKKIIAFFVFCALSVLGLLVLAYIYLLPWIAGKATGLVSEELEIQLGNSLSEVYLKEGAINDSATYYSNELVKQLDLHTKYPIHIYVIESKEINAFAVPGGNIFVYSGLLNKINSYHAYVALLGHEATHVIKRHSLKSMLSSAASGVLIAYFFGDINGFTGWAVSKADAFKQLNYSRALETEADQNGLQLMIKNKINPRGMLDLLKVLQKESEDMPDLMKYLSTHPATEDRIGAVSKDPSIGKVFPKKASLEDNFSKIKKSLSRL